MEDKFLIAGGWLVFVNVFTFGLFAYDKYCAQHDKWRIPEAKLLFWAALGGALGAGLAMEICHHKTLHLKFKFGVPLLLFVQIILIGLFLTNPDNILEKFFEVIK